MMIRFGGGKHCFVMSTTDVPSSPNIGIVVIVLQSSPCWLQGRMLSNLNDDSKKRMFINRVARHKRHRVESNVLRMWWWLLLHTALEY